MIAVDKELGYGIYSIPVAARIIGTNPKRLRRWLSKETGICRSRFDNKNAISFLDLLELMFIKMFRDENISLQTIRKAALKAAEKFETTHPFAVKQFDTDGKTIFATLVKDAHGDEEVIEDLRHGQYVFKQVIKPFFKKLEYGKQDAMKYWPLFKSGRVVLDPNRKLGQPIDSETGIPTQTLYNAVCAGDDVESVASWFNVPVKAVEQAVKFEKGL